MYFVQFHYYYRHLQFLRCCDTVYCFVYKKVRNKDILLYVQYFIYKTNQRCTLKFRNVRMKMFCHYPTICNIQPHKKYCETKIMRWIHQNGI